MREITCIWVSLACLLSSTYVEAQETNEQPTLILVETVDAPALVALARVSIDQHPQVLAAVAALDSRNALQLAADRPLFNPQLLAEYQSTDIDDAIIGISQTLDVADRRGARRDVALYEREAAVAELTRVRREIASELLSSLAEYWTASGLDELAEVRIDLMRSFSDLTLQRQQAGDVTQVDLNIANLANSQAEIEHASAEAARAGADQALRAVSPTQVPSVWPGLPDDIPPVSIDPQQIENLLLSLPEVRVLRAAERTAEATVNLRDRERRPSPTLSLVAGEEDGESLIGLTFAMPLNVRNRFKNEVVAAMAERSRARRAAENVEVRARHRLLAAIERYQLTNTAWQVWLETGEPNLDEQADLLERLVAAGELSTTEYLVQLNQTLDTAASAVELRRQLWIAWFDWLAASGQVDSWLGLSSGAQR